MKILRHFLYSFKMPGKLKKSFIKKSDASNLDDNRAWQIIASDIFSLNTYGAIWELEVNQSLQEKMKNDRSS